MEGDREEERKERVGEVFFLNPDSTKEEPGN